MKISYNKKHNDIQLLNDPDSYTSVDENALISKGNDGGGGGGVGGGTRQLFFPGAVFGYRVHTAPRWYGFFAFEKKQLGLQKPERKEAIMRYGC